MSEYMMEIGSVLLVGVILYAYFKFLEYLIRKDCDELGIK